MQNNFDEGNIYYEDIDEGLDTTQPIIKDRGKLCYVCDDSKIDFFFDCGKGLCRECLIEHLKAQIVKYKIKVLSKEIKFVCACSCRCPVKTELMERMMDRTTKELYQEVLFKMYLSKANDVVSCPKSDCPSSAFIEKRNSGLFCKLTQCYECPECKYTWNDDSINLKNFFSHSNFYSKISIQNVKSVVKKYLITKYCNNCSAPIEKAEGCKHIECNRCEYSFCWNCTGKWEGHVEKSCMGLLTNEYDEYLRVSCLPFIFFFISIMTLLKVVFSFWFIILFLYFLLKLTLFCALIVYDLFFAFGIFHIMKIRHSKILPLIPFSILLASDAVLFYYRLHPFNECFYFVCEIVSISILLLYNALRRS